jgi:hypothetical protein
VAGARGPAIPTLPIVSRPPGLLGSTALGTTVQHTALQCNTAHCTAVQHRVQRGARQPSAHLSAVGPGGVRAGEGTAFPAAGGPDLGRRTGSGKYQLKRRGVSPAIQPTLETPPVRCRRPRRDRSHTWGRQMRPSICTLCIAMCRRVMCRVWRVVCTMHCILCRVMCRWNLPPGLGAAQGSTSELPRQDCSAGQGSAVHRSAVQCSAVQCSAV